MDFDVMKRTIFYVRHGSHAYGLNVPSSDEDFKGVCIAPSEYYFGFMKKFEQHEHMGSKSDGVDSVIFALNKFAKLAADCNPNIIEILHVSDRNILKCDSFGEELKSLKDEFLSKKAKFTFTGYAHAQLSRIKTHRSWVMNPPADPPNRSDYHLSEVSKVSQSELGAFDAAVKDGIEIELPKDVLTLFTREKQYQAAKIHWDNYVSWKKSRNPARAALESKYGYDTKHGMHLLRLLTMGVEILLDHKVYVDREELGDREFFINVRNGLMSYEELIEHATKLNEQCESLYSTSTLRKEPDRVMLDRRVISLTERYLKLYG